MQQSTLWRWHTLQQYRLNFQLRLLYIINGFTHTAEIGPLISTTSSVVEANPLLFRGSFA